MNLLQKIEQQQLEKLKAETKVAEFGIGDTVVVNVKVVEGSRERVQAYEGVCIARKKPAPTRPSPCARSATAKASSACSRSTARASTRSSWCAAAMFAAPSFITCARCAARLPASPNAPITKRRLRPRKSPKRPKAPNLSDNIRQQPAVDLGDFIAQYQLALFEALNLDHVRHRALGQRVDRVVEVAVLGFEPREALFEIVLFAHGGKVSRPSGPGGGPAEGTACIAEKGPSRHGSIRAYFLLEQEPASLSSGPAL